MDRSLHTLFFSPTEGTAKVVRAVADGFGLDPLAHDLTLPGGRDRDLAFSERDVVIIDSTAPAVATSRPDAADLRAARAFGAEAAGKLGRHRDPGGLPELSVPGHFPYKDRPPRVPMAPETSGDCVGCRTCAEHCPTGAISLADPRRADPDRCIRCSSCVKRCRLKAKSFSHPDYLARRALLTASFSQVRRESETFL